MKVFYNFGTIDYSLWNVFSGNQNSESSVQKSGSLTAAMATKGETFTQAAAQTRSRSRRGRQIPPWSL
jgi:hypothetical protein